MLFLISACNAMSDGASITLSQEEYEEQLNSIQNSGVVVIFDEDVPLGESSKASDEKEDDVNPFIAQVLKLINAERKKEKLPPLSGKYKELNKAAEIRAEEIVDLFSHTRPNGERCFDALKEYNVNYKAAGENIAKGHKTPEMVVNSWMNSKGHRANIMNDKFNNIGIGLAEDSSGRLHWVQLFTN